MEVEVRGGDAVEIVLAGDQPVDRRRSTRRLSTEDDARAVWRPARKVGGTGLLKASELPGATPVQLHRVWVRLFSRDITRLWGGRRARSGRGGRAPVRVTGGSASRS